MGLSSALSGAVGVLPAGAVIPYAGSAAPAGWLLCGGQAVSRSDYAALFAIIGTTYGSGNGSTTFNVPDLRGRVVAGEDDMGGTAANRLTSGGSGISGTTLGGVGGSETHTLTTAQMPSHTHIQDSHNHTQIAHTHIQDSHNHSQIAHTHIQDAHSHTVMATNGWAPVISNISVGGGGVGYWSWTNVSGSQMVASNTTATNQNATATNNATTATNQNATATNNATTATNQNTGGGSAHNNVQPTMIMNYIIKAVAY